VRWMTWRAMSSWPYSGVVPSGGQGGHASLMLEDVTIRVTSDEYAEGEAAGGVPR